jgi:hypothetical protein
VVKAIKKDKSKKIKNKSNNKVASEYGRSSIK